MPLKVAIVGCGKIADGHIEEIQKMPKRGRVVAACDREALIAEQLCVRYGIPRIYDDFERMLEHERPDVVHITTPPQSHLPLAKLAVDAGAHIFVEKPFAMNARETRQILDYAHARRRKVTVGYRTYFDPPALAMRQLVHEGAVGHPVHVESHYGYDLTGQFGQALISDPTHWVHRLPGKLFHNIIDHLLNKVLEFIPDERPRIIVQSKMLRAERFYDERDLLHDELRLMIFGDRVTAYGTFSAHIRPVRESLRVYGTKNTLHADWAMRTVTLEPSGKLPSAIGRLVPAFEMSKAYLREGVQNVWRFAKADFHYFAGMSTLISRFYDSILHDEAPPYSYRDILRVSWVLDEIFRQVNEAQATEEMFTR